MNRYLLLMLLFPGWFLVTGRTVFAQDEEVAMLIREATQLYGQGAFAEARDAYEKAIARGANNGHLYYNLGNCFYRLGAIGRAIASYRRAARELPRDPDIEANLRLARSRAGGAVASEDQGADELMSRFLILNRQLSPYELRSSAFLLYAIFWGSVVLRGIVRRRWSQALLVLSGLSLTLVSCAAFGVREGHDGRPILALTPASHKIRPGVIVVSEGKAYSGDSTSFQVVFVLRDGAEVEVGEIRNDWVQVLLPGDTRGWVRRDEIEIL